MEEERAWIGEVVSGKVQSLVWGRGPEQSARERRFSSFKYSIPHPRLSSALFSHKYLKCGYGNNAEVSEMESRANSGWMSPMFA